MTFLERLAKLAEDGAPPRRTMTAVRGRNGKPVLRGEEVKPDRAFAPNAPRVKPDRAFAHNAPRVKPDRSFASNMTEDEYDAAVNLNGISPAARERAMRKFRRMAAEEYARTAPGVDAEIRRF